MNASPYFSLAAVLCTTPAAGLLAGGAPAEISAPRTVGSLVAEIIARNPERAFYEAEIEAARAGHRLAGSREYPSLSLEIGRKRVSEPGGGLTGEGTAWAASVSQTFDWPGRIALRKAIANQDVALAQLGLVRFEAALGARARARAFGLHAARGRAAAAAEVAARHRALREVFLAREPGGIAPLLETRVIEAQELALGHRATDAHLAVRAAEVELNLLQGLPPATPVPSFEGDPVVTDPPGLEALLDAAREKNFEFLAARLELEQQGMVVSLARQERRPTLTVSPFYSEENAGERERTFGIGVSMPLPLSPRTGASVAGAEARRRQAEAALLVAEREMERQVVGAAHAVAARLQELNRWPPDAAERFREAAALADRHYRLGAVPIGTYVELQNAYLEAVDAIHETRLEAIEAAQELERLTGLELCADAAPAVGETQP